MQPASIPSHLSMHRLPFEVRLVALRPRCAGSAAAASSGRPGRAPARREALHRLSEWPSAGVSIEDDAREDTSLHSARTADAA